MSLVSPTSSAADAAVQMNCVLPRVYADLRALAGHCLRSEHRAHTLQPTALVHEVVLRLLRQRSAIWRTEGNLLALASMFMRNVLVDHARVKRAARRGGGKVHTTQLDEAVAAFESRSTNLIALDEALERLAEIDERKSKIVELRFYGGLHANEVAKILDISRRTVEREWQFARAWLQAELA